MVSYTIFMGKARERNGQRIWPKVVILIGKGGVAVQIPSPIIVGRMWHILQVVKEINEQISPYDFGSARNDDDEDRQVDEFNPPEDVTPEDVA
jgi:hypothetical protein